MHDAGWYKCFSCFKGRLATAHKNVWPNSLIIIPSGRKQWKLSLWKPAVTPDPSCFKHFSRLVFQPRERRKSRTVRRGFGRRVFLSELAVFEMNHSHAGLLFQDENCDINHAQTWRNPPIYRCTCVFQSFICMLRGDSTFCLFAFLTSVRWEDISAINATDVLTKLSARTKTDPVHENGILSTSAQK